MSRLGRRNQHTKQSCLASAEQHQTKKSWQETDPKMVSAARRHGWYAECTLHMRPLPQGGQRKWTKRKCSKSASIHTNVSEWKENDYRAYTAAKRYGWLTDVTKHFVPLGNKIKRYVYIIRVRNTRLVYVGLSRNIKKRWSAHLSSTRFLEIQKELGPDCLRLFTCKKLFKAEDAADLEKKLIREYKSRGFTELNKKKGGGLGASSSIWDYNAVSEDAKNYDFIGIWSIESHAAYTAALNNDWIEQLVSSGIIARQNKPHGFWTKERIKNSALEHTTRQKWRDEDPKAYSAASSAGLLNDPEVVGHFVRAVTWTDEKLIVEVAKFKSLSELRKGSPSAYQTIKKQKRLKDFTSKLKRGRRANPWTEEEVLTKAREFTTKNDFHKNGEGAYQAAKRLGIFEIATQHMVDQRKKK